MSALSKILKKRRKELGLTLAQVADAVGVTEATVQRWESGNIKTVRYEKLAPSSSLLGVSPADLMGWSSDDDLPSNISRIEPMQKIPLVGQIACGTPILAEQNIEDYVDLPGHIRADFALTCKGESMIGAGIRTGDIVYIRKQEEVENGQIAAVMVGGDEATLKRVYTKPGVVQLVAENPNIAPAVFIGKEAEQIHIIGLAVAYTHVLD
jgi:repressor LexA